MNLLAIDTTESGCSAALLFNGEVSARFELAPRRHSELIVPMMDELLADAGIRPQQLDGLVFAAGPGSFTGLRIAASVIQGVALGIDRPVVAVSSLAALAQGCYRATGAMRVIPAFDARMGEIYLGFYQMKADVMEAFAADRLVAPEDLKNERIISSPICGAGSGWEAYPDALSDCFGPASDCIYPLQQVQAEDLLALGQAELDAGKGIAAAQALPVYLRNQVAKKSNKSVLTGAMN